MVIFYRKHEDENYSVSGDEISEVANEVVNKDVERLYEYIKNNPGQRTGIISEALGVSLKTIERWIKKLRDDDKIEFVGSAKTGGYYLKEGLTPGEVINEGLKKLYEYIKNNPGQRAGVFSDALGVSLKTIERWIKKLRDDDKIEFVGSAKSGGYYIKKKSTPGKD